MKKVVIFLLCVLVFTQTEVLGKSGGGSRGGSFHSSSSRSSSHIGSSKISSRSMNFRSGSKNASKVGSGGSKGIRSFSESSSPKSISKYVGKPFSKPKTVSTSRNAHRAVSYSYTRPVRFSNPYLMYYLLAGHSSNHRDSMRVDTSAFPGFGKGKSGGAGASMAFSDSIKKHSSKDTLEITELLPINYLSDYAGIIPDKDEPKINYLIRHYKKMTGVEIGVLTIPTLGDEIDLEDFAQVLFDKWGIGEAGINNGMLIIISSEDEILRVQPGYGMEEFFPDIICRQIEDDIMLPPCKKQEWELATIGAINDITKRLGDKPIEEMKKELALKKQKEHEEMVNTFYMFLKVIAFIVFVALLWIMIKNLKKRRVL